MKKILLGLLLSVTMCLSIQAEDRFENVIINGVDVDEMTIPEAVSVLNDICVPQIYIKTDASTQILNAKDIGAEYTEDMLLEVYSSAHSPASILPQFDVEKLDNSIHTLMQTQEQILPQDAKLIYDETAKNFTIQKEIGGTAVDEAAISEVIQEKLKTGWPFLVFSDESPLLPEMLLTQELNDGWRFWITASDYRLMPEKTADDLKPELESANQMLQTEVIISDTVQQLIVDKDTLIQNHMITSEGTLDETAVSSFVDTYKFNTQGLVREITSPATGTFCQGDGVFYSTVDKEKETAKLISEIRSGIQEERYPEYEISMDNNSGIGDTFIEVSIDNQKVYLIRNGEIEFTTDCVTGCVNTGHDTPKGICYINSKYRDITLQKYNAFVNYWMAFIGSTYGLHDASWRSSEEFGGETYLNNGSHGCVNMKHDDIKYLYENTEKGIPVIVH